MITRPIITLFVPLSGRHWAWPRFSDFLERQVYPHQNIKLILCDTSQNKNFTDTVHKWVMDCDYLSVEHFEFAAAAPGLADLDRMNHRTERSVNMAMCRIYNQLRKRLNTDLCWTLEDDIIPPLDVLIKMIDLLTARTGAVTAAYYSRYDSCITAWTRDDNEQRLHQSRKALKKQNGTQKIRGCGFGCLLVRTELLKNHSFYLTESGQYYDPVFFREMGDEWDRILAWDLECEHMEEANNDESIMSM